MSQRSYRGISEHQEVDRNTRRPDTRTLWKRLSSGWRTTDGVIVFNALLMLAGVFTVKLPLSGEICVVLAWMFWRIYVNPAKARTWNFPYRVPMRAKLFDGSYPSAKNPKTGKTEFRVGDGITFFGKEFGTNLEIWAANSDLRTHNLVLGTTGSGKTELLLGIVFNALIQNSGLIYCDGKGDVALYDNVFRLARILDRTDDILVINFISGGRDLSGKSTDRPTNTLNPYATSSSSMQNELNISLMDDGGGSGDMWKGRAIAFVSALSRPLCWLRDRGYMLLDPGAYIAFFELPSLEKLIWDKKFVGIGGEEFTVKDPDFDESLKPLETYLGTLPGYSKEKKGKQEQKTLEQHGFITMQLTRTFGDLTFTYGHIFRHKLGEIDFVDVVLNRRILLVLLPSLERSPDSLKALGKLVVGNLKAMMGSSLGSSLEGERRQIIEARPTTAKVPFYDILDEYGYYAVLGFAVAPAQARSLAHSITFAAQDFSSLQKASKEEADATWENTNVRMIGRITSGEESETWRRIRGVAGDVDVDSFGQKEFKTGDLVDGYVTNRDTTTEKVGRIAYDDLAAQQDGEFHFLVGKKEDGGKRGRVRVIRGRSFYTGIEKGEYHAQLRINHFLKVEPPSAIDRGDAEGLTKVVVEKLISKAVATEFGGQGGEGVKGVVATTFVSNLYHAPQLAQVGLLERGMVALAALALRTRSDFLQAAAQAQAISGINAGLAAAASAAQIGLVGTTEAVSDVSKSGVVADVEAPQALVSGGKTLGIATGGGQGGSGGEGSGSGAGQMEFVIEEMDEPGAGNGASQRPPQPLPGTPATGSQADAEVFATELSASEGFEVGEVFIPEAADIRSEDDLLAAVAQIRDGFQTIPFNEHVVAASVERVATELAQSAVGFEPPEDLAEEEPQVVATNVTQALIDNTMYAEVPHPQNVTEETLNELLRKIVETGRSGEEAGIGGM